MNAAASDAQESNGICDLLRPSDASNRDTRERSAVRFRFEGFGHCQDGVFS